MPSLLAAPADLLPRITLYLAFGLLTRHAHKALLCTPFIAMRERRVQQPSARTSPEKPSSLRSLTALTRLSVRRYREHTND